MSSCGTIDSELVLIPALCSAAVSVSTGFAGGVGSEAAVFAAAACFELGAPDAEAAPAGAELAAAIAAPLKSWRQSGVGVDDVVAAG